MFLVVVTTPTVPGRGMDMTQTIDELIPMRPSYIGIDMTQYIKELRGVRRDGDWLENVQLCLEWSLYIQNRYIVRRGSADWRLIT